MPNTRGLSLRGDTKSRYGRNQWTRIVRRLGNTIWVVVGFCCLLLMQWNQANAELMVYIKVGDVVKTIEDGSSDEDALVNNEIVVDVELLNDYFQENGQIVTFSETFIVTSDVPYDENLNSWIRRLNFQYDVTNGNATSTTVEVIATLKGANIGPSLPGYDRTMFLNASGNFGNDITEVTDPTAAKFAAIFDQDQSSTSQNGGYTDSLPNANPYVIGQDASWSAFGSPNYNALRDGLTPTTTVNGDSDGLYSLMLASRVELAAGDYFNTAAETSFLVPEPASIAMWGLGYLLVWKRVRRKN